jgi:hypothetical protein
VENKMQLKKSNRGTLAMNVQQSNANLWVQLIFQENIEASPAHGFMEPKDLSSRLTKRQSKALSATISFTNLSSNAQPSLIVYGLVK